MPTIIHCPSCERQLRVPDELLGAKVKCPTCNGTFDATNDAGPAVPPPQPVPRPTERVSAEPRREPEPDRDELSPRPRDHADAWRPCPHCGEEIRKEAAHCRFCGQDVDDADREDERPWERADRHAVRRDCEPHRGTLILVLGILSIVLATMWFLSIVSLPMGIAAWIMGRRDLKKIDAKAMDPEGRGTTQAGYICSIVGTILSVLMLLCCAGYIGLISFGMWTAASMPPPPPRSPAPVVVPVATKKQPGPGAPMPPPKLKDKDAGVGK
jgi:predicted Zn finger-like uncharacterized protein